MQDKESYTIDFTNVRSSLEMHFIIRKALNFPDFYGCNWDAFWDCLTNMLGKPIYIEIIGFDTVEQKFGDDAREMIETLKDFKHYGRNLYENDICIEIVYGKTRINLT